MKAGGGAEQDYENEAIERPVKKSNSLPIWGNEKTMNLNPLILTNIQSSQYFKVNLYQLKTYHEVIDEIYYKVNHLEPWEKGSRKTSGQTGMCGGVRGVGAGGIVSTAFCILYKLYTLKLTRKQVQGLINHSDSPYIRGLGFMYIRFTQPPADLWEWLESYLDDEEEIDVRAGGGQTSTIGTIVRHMLTKLEWHSTLFPRIPVPIQKEIEKKLTEKGPVKLASSSERYSTNRECMEDSSSVRRREEPNGEFRRNRDYQERDERDRRDREDKFKERDYKEREKHRERHRERERSADRIKERHREKDHKSRDKDRDRRHHHPSSRGHYRDERERSYSYEIEREKDRIKRERRKSRSCSRSRDQSRRHH